MSGAIKRMRGVESVEISLKQGLARIGLAAGNTVRLERIRDAIKGAGFTPKDAEVTVRGKAERAGNAWQFRVEGVEAAYPLRVDEKLAGEIGARSGQVMVLEGAIAAPTDPRTPPEFKARTMRAE